MSNVTHISKGSLRIPAANISAAAALLREYWGWAPDKKDAYAICDTFEDMFAFTAGFNAAHDYVIDGYTEAEDAEIEDVVALLAPTFAPESMLVWQLEGGERVRWLFEGAVFGPNGEVLSGANRLRVQRQVKRWQYTDEPTFTSGTL